MKGRVMDTSVVTPARQRLRLRMPSLRASAAPIAQPMLLRASVVKSGTGPGPALAPRITSSTAITPSTGVFGATVVTKI